MPADNDKKPIKRHAQFALLLLVAPPIMKSMKPMNAATGPIHIGGILPMFFFDFLLIASISCLSIFSVNPFWMNSFFSSCFGAFQVGIGGDNGSNFLSFKIMSVRLPMVDINIDSRKRESKYINNYEYTTHLIESNFD